MFTVTLIVGTTPKADTIVDAVLAIFPLILWIILRVSILWIIALIKLIKSFWFGVPLTVAFAAASSTTTSMVYTPYISPYNVDSKQVEWYVMLIIC